jgi:hypothetical protein
MREISVSGVRDIFESSRQVCRVASFNFARCEDFWAQEVAAHYGRASGVPAPAAKISSFSPEEFVMRK